MGEDFSSKEGEAGRAWWAFVRMLAFPLKETFEQRRGLIRLVFLYLGRWGWGGTAP